MLPEVALVIAVTASRVVAAPQWPSTTTADEWNSQWMTISEIAPESTTYPPQSASTPWSIPPSESSSSSYAYYTTPTITYATSTTSSYVYTSSVMPSGPCASVSELAAAFTEISPSATPTVPAELAYACLNSIPFNQTAAEQYLSSIDPYLNWQTTFEYLKYPPSEYVEYIQPPYDFFATWSAIKANTSAGAYQNEYQFGWTVYRAFQLAHDGHLVIYPDSVTSIFSFARRLPLVSVSLDGVSDPKPYLYSDILASSYANTTFTPSPIVQIDGQDAIEYLLVWSEYGSLQDPDALWNNLFYEPAQVALGSAGSGAGVFSGGGRGRWPYPGPTTTLQFANGSTLVQQNVANVLADFTNVTSGEDIYAQYLTPPPEAYQNIFEYASSTAISPSSSTTSEAPSSTPTSVPAPGYPTPFVSETNNLNGGYFIGEPGYEDVAVLVVRSFVSTGDDEIPFQAVNTYFIEQAAAMGKTKLIIDVSANGGGTILQGYDLFKQLFPSIVPYGASRFRAHEALDLLGEQSSYLSGLVPRTYDANQTFQDIESSAFNYRTDADNDYQPFTSWAEKYGPDSLGPEGDNFTSLIRWNLSDVYTPINSGGIVVSGYLNRTNITMQPFAAENIVIVTDGYCASTCTIFSELMTQQAGVKTIALGGRPGVSGAESNITNGDRNMQAIGGVKGTNDYGYDYIFSALAEVFGASNTSLQYEWQYATYLSDYIALPYYRSNVANLNVRNGYRQGDASQTPLQFVYEPADCRILYTPAMVVDETVVWKTVADSVWGSGNGGSGRGGDACIAGAGFGKESQSRRSRRDGNAHGKGRVRRNRLPHQARRDVLDSHHALDVSTITTDTFVARNGRFRRSSRGAGSGNSFMIP